MQYPLISPRPGRVSRKRVLCQFLVVAFAELLLTWMISVILTPKETDDLNRAMNQTSDDGSVVVTYPGSVGRGRLGVTHIPKIDYALFHASGSSRGRYSGHIGSGSCGNQFNHFALQLPVRTCHGTGVSWVGLLTHSHFRRPHRHPYLKLQCTTDTDRCPHPPSD